MYAGILVRAMERVDDMTFIEGSCNCATALLKTQDCSEVKEFLAKTKNFTKAGVLDKSNILHVIEDAKVEDHEVFECARVGLTFKQ